MPVTRAHAADDRRPDRFQSIVVDQTVAMAGVDQAIDDELAIEFAASDQLGQTKGATVEGMRPPGAVLVSISISRSSATRP